MTGVYGTILKEPIILKNDEYKGYEYYITTLGTHPCTYILLPKEDKYYGKDYWDIPLDCHGGLTYSEDHLPLRINDSKDSWVIGWDYAHYDDFLCYPELSSMEYIHGHEWTLDELINEVMKTIDELITL